jgi:hypothetical protein
MLWTKHSSYLAGFKRAAEICAGDGAHLTSAYRLAQISLEQCKDSKPLSPDNRFWHGLEDGILTAYGY